MTSYKRQWMYEAYKAFDLVVMVCAFAYASIFNALVNNSTLNIEDFFAMRVKVRNMLILAFIFLAWQALFSVFGMHRPRRMEKQHQQTIDILKMVTISTCILLGIAVLFNIKLINEIFLFNFWATSTLLLMLSRMLLGAMLQKARLKGRNLRHMLIVGTGKRAVKFANTICDKPELGYHIIGFADDQWEGSETINKCGFPLISDLAGLPALLRSRVIDEVVIGLPFKSHYEKISGIITACEEQGIIVRFLSDLFNLKLAKSKPGFLDDIPLVTLQAASHEHPALFIKRIIDIVLSGIIVTCLSPVFLVIALLIKLDSKGPVFFIQERVGHNKRRFKLIKFRSMVQGAELRQDELEELNEASGPVFKIEKDPRMTRAGKWLRKTSLDELPQFINILIGDMSLVGPRPLPVRDYNGFDQDWHRRRFSVRPGLTCLWQVNGRSSIAFDKWMKFDMEYIDNWSLLLDMKILIKTVPAIIKGSGAT